MGDPVFPPGNFTIWPLTRTGAITFDTLVLIIALILWFVSRRIYRRERLLATCQHLTDVRSGLSFPYFINNFSLFLFLNGFLGKNL